MGTLIGLIGRCTSETTTTTTTSPCPLSARLPRLRKPVEDDVLLRMNAVHPEFPIFNRADCWRASGPDVDIGASTGKYSTYTSSDRPEDGLPRHCT